MSRYSRFDLNWINSTPTLSPITPFCHYRKLALIYCITFQLIAKYALNNKYFIKIISLFTNYKQKFNKNFINIDKTEKKKKKSRAILIDINSTVELSWVKYTGYYTLYTVFSCWSIINSVFACNFCKQRVDLLFWANIAHHQIT